MPVIGLIIVLAMMMVGIGGNVGPFLDFPSILLVLGVTIGALVLSRAGIANMFGAVFSDEVSKSHLEMAADAWRQARTYSMASGWLCILIGGINMAKTMDDYSQLGAGLAVLVLPMFYAVLLGYGIYLPLQKLLEGREAAD